ncbi:hypothetical protein [Shimia isoporae]|uniref:hypothetical protein n=1 Tax=Shimia isoporae TaxID=647720 RepID=UPI001404D606|nr:hypothetical protein [Shimia isoporae]
MLLATPALPCAFHGYTPVPTLVEKLIDSSDIVLARPSPQNLFRFTPVEVLRGEVLMDEIPHLVDSATRRRIANKPEDRVLFAKNALTGEWTRLAYIDGDMDDALREIMQRLPDWRDGELESRAAYFSTLLGHDNAALNTLALRELDLLDYGTFRALSLQIDAARLQSRLNILTELDLQPIRVLLLGLSDQQGMTDFFREGVRLHAKSDGPMIGAYGLALLEYQGAAAVEWIVQRQLAPQALPAQARSTLVAAMAIHHEVGAAETSVAIRDALARAVVVDRELASLVNLHFNLMLDETETKDLGLEVVLALTTVSSN